MLLIRHAESTWNATGRWQGHADPPLSDEGVRQAQALARTLGGRALDRIVASDLRRAAQTARILADALRVPLDLDPRLREHDVGAWSGLRHEEIVARWPEEYARFRAGDPELPFGGAESLRDLQRRVRAAVSALREAHAGRPLALVTHAGVIRALDGRLVMKNASVACWDGTFVDAPPGTPSGPRESR